MIYYITFVGLPFKYYINNAGNKTQALATISKYRNDAIANGDEPKLSFKQAEKFHEKWHQLCLDDIKQLANTKKKYKLQDANKNIKYIEIVPHELEEILKQEEPKGQFFTVNGARLFLKKVGKEQTLVYAISEISRIPKTVDLPVIQSIDTPELTYE
jgi:hypothetical protein